MNDIAGVAGAGRWGRTRGRVAAWLSMAGSPIGARLQGWRAWAALAIGLAVVAADLWGAGPLIEWTWGALGTWPSLAFVDLPRLVLGLGGLLALLALGARPRTLGLVGPVRPRLAFWPGAAIACGLAVVVAGTLLLPFALRFYPEMVHHTQSPPPLDLVRVLHAIIVAPLVEEPIYRLALVPGLVAVLGPRWAIVVDGIIFAALHFFYGNPGLDNFVGGYVFAWAYVRSGSLYVPMTLHALGNACAVFGSHVLASLGT